MLTERLFPLREGPITIEEYQLHGLLLGFCAAMTLFALFFHSLWSGLWGVAWVSLAVLSGIPKDGSFSWNIGRAEAKRRAVERATAAAPVIADEDGALELDTTERASKAPKSPSVEPQEPVNFNPEEGIDIVPIPGMDTLDVEETKPIQGGAGDKGPLPYADFGFKRSPSDDG